ncbi:MAG: DUF1736 domain-containing protein [Bacteroidota bacterium]
MFPTNFWKKHLLPAGILFFLAIALYAYSVTFDYVLDDQIVLTNNEFTKKGFAGIPDILTKESFVGRFGEQKNLVTGARYRPLSIVIFAVEYQFFGANPIVSHGINILLYALLGLLLFRVFSLFFPKSTATSNHLKERWHCSIPFLATLLFVVHPVHTEVVANVKGRDEIMTLLGALAALYYSFQYVAKGHISYLLLSFTTFFLALLSKENALTFLAVIPLALYFFTKTSYRKIGITLLPLVLASVAYLWIRYLVIGYFLSSDGAPITDIMNNPFYSLSSSERFATVFYTLGLYVKLLFFPYPLTHDYYPYQIPIISFGDVRAIIPIVLYVILGIIALLGIKKKSVLSFSVLTYLATLSIVSNLPFTVGTFMNERFLFMPSIGFCLILAWLFADRLPDFLTQKYAKNRAVSQAVGLAVIGVFTLGFIGKTLDRVPDWKNRMTLNVSGASASPNSARANCFLGTAIFEEEYKKATDTNQKQQLIQEVAFFIDRALAIHPNYGSALIMHSGVVAEEYKYDRDLPKLLSEFYSILTRKSNIPFIGEYLAYLSSRVDQKQLADFAYQTGYEFFGQTQKDYNNAIKYLNYGLQAAPTDRRLLQSMGNIYQLTGNSEQAAIYFGRIK